jgi:hypothetical protein
MPQAVCFWAWPFRVSLHYKKLQLRALVEAQINLPVITLQPVVLPDDRKAEKVMIERKRSILVRADDSDVVDCVHA